MEHMAKRENLLGFWRRAQLGQAMSTVKTLLNGNISDDFLNCFNFAVPMGWWKPLKDAHDQTLKSFNNDKESRYSRQSWTIWGEVLEAVTKDNKRDAKSIGHFASQATMRDVSAYGVSRMAKQWIHNDQLPSAPDLNDCNTLNNAIRLAFLACSTVTNLSPRPGGGLTKVVIPYCLALPRMMALQEANSEQTLIASIVAMSLRVLKAFK